MNEAVDDMSLVDPDRQRARAYALGRVQGPAIGLIVTAILGVLGQLVGLAVNILGVGMAVASENDRFGSDFGSGSGLNAQDLLLQGSFGAVVSVVGVILGIVILLGALRMKRLQSHGFALTAAVVAMVPCLSPCCLVGLPIGIWALIVLLDAQVKSAFR